MPDIISVSQFTFLFFLCFATVRRSSRVKMISSKGKNNNLEMVRSLSDYLKEFLEVLGNNHEITESVPGLIVAVTPRL